MYEQDLVPIHKPKREGAASLNDFQCLISTVGWPQNSSALNALFNTACTKKKKKMSTLHRTFYIIMLCLRQWLE